MNIVINKTPVDPFTLVHMGSGAVSRHFGFTFAQTLIGGFIWDYALEPELKRQFPSAFPYPSQDAPKHMFVDAIAPAVGWLLYDWWARRNGKQLAPIGPDWRQSSM